MEDVEKQETNEQSLYEWADTFTAAEWIGDQDEDVQKVLNATIRSMIKKRRDKRMSQKEIRTMDAGEFVQMINSFNAKYKLTKKYGFLEKQ